jgi:hypothetical protein
MLCPAVAPVSLSTVTVGSGTVTVKGIHPSAGHCSVAAAHRAYRCSRSAGVEEDAGEIGGSTSISWPPVCVTLLMTNCPPAAVPMESHSSSLLKPTWPGSEI